MKYHLSIISLVALSTSYSVKYPLSSGPFTISCSQTQYANPLADKILERIYDALENPESIFSAPFCLTEDLSDIRNLISPYLDFIRSKKTKEEIVQAINYIFKKEFKISHFLVDPFPTIKEFEEIDEEGNLSIYQGYEPKVCLHHKNECKCYSINEGEINEEKKIYTLTIPNFYPHNFQSESLKIYFELAQKRHFGVILDLRGNIGGYTFFMRHILKYFIPVEDWNVRYINANHMPLIENVTKYRGNYSKENMTSLIQTIKEGLDKEKDKYNIKADEEKSSPYEFFNKEYQGTYPKHAIQTTRTEYIQGKIAILIDEETHSNAEILTLILKEAVETKDRVKVIGKKSYGGILMAEETTFEDLEINFMYPSAELVSIHGTRIEGVGITPDSEAHNDEEAMRIAEEWVTLD